MIEPTEVYSILLTAQLIRGIHRLFFFRFSALMAVAMITLRRLQAKQSALEQISDGSPGSRSSPVTVG
jgi:hypothetical protein